MSDGDRSRLTWLPIGFFGSVMGLAGLSADWRLAHVLWGVPTWIAQGIGGVTLLAFLALTAAYGVKAATGLHHVRAEFAHPVSGALFGTPLISALLVPIVLSDYSLPLARGLWFIGVAGMTLLAWFMTTRWLSGGQQRIHATPAWIVPLVGMLDIPLAVPTLGFSVSPHGIMVWGLAVGLFFTVPLFSIIFARLLFEEPMPDAMAPSLLILMAPFAVGFSAYVLTIGRVDALAEGLLVLTLFLFVALLARLRYLGRCCPFRVSWWSVSFPLAASAGAALRFAVSEPSVGAEAIAAVLLAVGSVAVVFLLWRTVAGLLRGELQNLSR